MDLKPRKEWKLNCSIAQGRTNGGQIRWKGKGANGQDRFLVMLERNRTKPDYFKRSVMVEGSVRRAIQVMDELQAEYEALQGERPTQTKVSPRTSSTAESASAGPASATQAPATEPGAARTQAHDGSRLPRASTPLRAKAPAQRRRAPFWAIVLGACFGAALATTCARK